MKKTLSMPSRQKAGSLAQQVVNILTRRMADGHMPAGEKFPTEAQLMQELAVSRTVIREAISHLQAAGMVETRHGVGTFVLSPSPSQFIFSPATIVTIRDIIAMMELRVSLETEAASLAAQRRLPHHLDKMQAAVAQFAQLLEANDPAVDADMNFHLEVARATDNSYFEDIYSYLGLTTIPRTRIDTTRFSVESGEPYLIATNREHGHILQAIHRQDPDCARSAMRLHLTNSIERLRKVVRQIES